LSMASVSGGIGVGKCGYYLKLIQIKYLSS
jgi:hypothetical protein